MVISYPSSGNSTANRAKISASDPVVSNPDSAPYGGTIGGLGNELPNAFAEMLYVNGHLQTWVL